MTHFRVGENYQRTVAVVGFIRSNGSRTKKEICKALNLTEEQFQDARYSKAGKQAMEDLGVMIPRPIATEGWVYKIADGYQTGTANDAEFNLQKSLSIAVGSQATVVGYYRQALEMVPTSQRALRRKLKAVVTMERAALEAGASALEQTNAVPSAWARHVRDMA